MAALLERLSTSGATDDILLVGNGRTVTRAGLVHAVAELARSLRVLNVRSIALYADNGVDWVLVDLACQLAGLRVTPLPLFFSAEQAAHAIATCGADALATDRSQSGIDRGGIRNAVFEQALSGAINLYRLGDGAGNGAVLPAGTQKITFTSGTTGTPKGVCLSAGQQLTVANAIASTLETGPIRHLCVLPLSTLLENIAGVYAPLIAGGQIVVLPLAELGITGSSELDTSVLLAGIARHRPGSLIIVPEMLCALTAAAECGWRVPDSLEFIAVGGGMVSPELLHRARSAGLQAYEGYGLSECASVVCLNTPGADRPGAVGHPLPHAGVRIDRGEIVVSGSVFLGYTGRPQSWNPGEVRTGDLGRIDGDGFLYIDGRAKNQLITSYGRNLSPEWVESELLAGPLLKQAVVFGDARPYCVALVCPREDSTDDRAIGAWIAQVNQRLPDYARVLDWCRLWQPISGRDGTATDNGRPKRVNIEKKYRTVIDGMYVNQLEAARR